jgi:Alpha/beta hydrolase domain
VGTQRRRAIIERYPNAEAYVAAITAAARQLVEEGLMLGEDIERAANTDWGRPRHDIKLK